MTRFGLNVPLSNDPSADPVGDARRAEELGFDFVSYSDHLHGDSPTWEPWTMLSWIAASTRRIRVLTRVLAVSYRSPAVVAKMAETFDRLSGGRLMLGLGGGYLDEEFRAFGLPVPSPRDKIDGLEEAIRVIRGLWSEPAFTFEGRLHRTEAATLAPRPDHPIPIWVGTYGPRALNLTGRLADGWIPSLGFAPPDDVTRMRERVLAAAERAGRDPAGITCAYNLVIRVDERAEPDPKVVSGSPEAIAEQLRGFTGIGFTAFNFMPTGPGADEQADRLGREVLPLLRD
ncbi:MAG TPA: LLM class flavin-dependent oxidoreductase [Actinomycetota bacterium]|nr:LLM class flavin-dependent oxidoreductase [Actinomycetota bacterium]